MHKRSRFMKSWNGQHGAARFEEMCILWYGTTMVAKLDGMVVAMLLYHHTTPLQHQWNDIKNSMLW